MNVPHVKRKDYQVRYRAEPVLKTINAITWRGTEPRHLFIQKYIASTATYQKYSIMGGIRISEEFIHPRRPSCREISPPAGDRRTSQLHSQHWACLTWPNPENWFAVSVHAAGWQRDWTSTRCNVQYIKKIAPILFKRMCQFLCYREFSRPLNCLSHDLYIGRFAAIFFIL